VLAIVGKLTNVSVSSNQLQHSIAAMRARSWTRMLVRRSVAPRDPSRVWRFILIELEASRRFRLFTSCDAASSTLRADFLVEGAAAIAQIVAWSQIQTPKAAHAAGSQVCWRFIQEYV
jgi:hypothetical protein